MKEIYSGTADCQKHCHQLALAVNWCLGAPVLVIKSSDKGQTDMGLSLGPAASQVCGFAKKLSLSFLICKMGIKITSVLSWGSRLNEILCDSLQVLNKHCFLYVSCLQREFPSHHFSCFLEFRPLQFLIFYKPGN